MKEFGNADECWVWPRSLNPVTGYGQLSEWVNGKRLLHTAHRIAFKAFYGEIPEGKFVCHSCDNRACFNPGHLFSGTQSDNMRDMVAKGRFVKGVAYPHWTKLYPEKLARGDNHPSRKKAHCLKRGVDHHQSKITEADAIAIRTSNEKGVTLAKRYGITPSTVSSIRHGRIWKHVP